MRACLPPPWPRSEARVRLVPGAVLWLVLVASRRLLAACVASVLVLAPLLAQTQLMARVVAVRRPLPAARQVAVPRQVRRRSVVVSLGAPPSSKAPRYPHKVRAVRVRAC